MKVELHGAPVPPDVLADGIEWDEPVLPAPAPPPEKRVYLKRGHLIRYLQKATARWLRAGKKILRRKARNSAEEQRRRDIEEAKQYIGIP